MGVLSGRAGSVLGCARVHFCALFLVIGGNGGADRFRGNSWGSVGPQPRECRIRQCERSSSSVQRTKRTSVLSARINSDKVVKLRPHSKRHRDSTRA